MFLTDTHCHLDFDVFQSDFKDVVQRCKAAGLHHIIDPGIDIKSCRAAIRLAEAHPGFLFAAVGIHPNDAQGWNENTLPALREMAAHPRVVAIGEIGLDYYRDRVARPVQHARLREQLTLAAEAGKPVILHSRDANGDIYPILKNWCADLKKTGSPLAERPGVMHSFDGAYVEAARFTALGFKIGIGGPVTYANAKERQALAAALPLKDLLLETDAPFLTPVPRRGQRNEPAYVQYVAQKIAELKHTAIEAVAEAAFQNSIRLFGIGEL
ncbi:MAG TPA: TatD family hydrolase [Anaerolineaceae bacterium]|nr:TatD family hydrolase [Anaerolineaceae bacterium]HPN52930.1 TatD family hydrolase [Anaerolineaceae bacterium]